MSGAWLGSAEEEKQPCQHQQQQRLDSSSSSMIAINSSSSGVYVGHFLLRCLFPPLSFPFGTRRFQTFLPFQRPPFFLFQPRGAILLLPSSKEGLTTRSRALNRIWNTAHTHTRAQGAGLSVSKWELTPEMKGGGNLWNRAEKLRSAGILPSSCSSSYLNLVVLSRKSCWCPKGSGVFSRLSVHRENLAKPVLSGAPKPGIARQHEKAVCVCLSLSVCVCVQMDL